MVGIDSQNASLTVETDGATPGVAFAPFGNATRAVLHLTRGFTNFRDTESIKHAWTASAQAPAQTKSGTVGDEELGFLQTQSVEVMQYFYAGEKRSHGSLTIDVGQGLNPKICLDSEDDVAPFTSSVRSFDNGTWRAMTGDHPASRCILKLGNVATNKPNFLFHAIDRRSFVTVLTFRLGTQFIPLRWFKWSVSHNVVFRWEGGLPKVRSNSSRISFGEVKFAQPDSTVVRKIISKPGKPFANVITRSAMQGVVVGDLTGRTSNPEWFVNVPQDFWT